MEECMARIKKLVDDAKREAGLSQEIVLNGLGLCLSGCEQKTTNISLEENLHKRYPNLAEVIFVASDTIGSLMSACANGGINLISGTGSNCLLMNPDGATYQSGGWGHMIGDEGSAYWIASKTVKVIYDEEDNLIEPPYPTTTLKKLVFEHFDLNDRGIEIVCSGSVFRSWDLLKSGFMEGIKPRSQKDVEIPKFTLLKLEVSSAYGAIYQASKKSGYPLPKEYEKNSSVLFSYTRDEKQMNGHTNGNGHSNGTRNGNGLLEKKEVFSHSINNNRF
ncbi:N-acetyl-D-glucosamine kinase [Armadillidium nasatum]|uniref:N-acetyl-D-glucosamine kinase n=1 Tax=Armadillidium nasatum TaxID=96803 RepID=A0A5N5TN09_9CRUS|nr:N-acetyl-D-glucosamine kinase [Armadillidium nasatum]